MKFIKINICNLIHIFSIFMVISLIGPHSTSFDSGIGMGAIATVTAGGALASGGTALPVAGAAQIVGALVCFWADPPDTLNAGIPVNFNDYFVQFPDALTIDPSLDLNLVNAFDLHMDDLDNALTFARARNAAMDRYEGALLLGNSDWC